MRSILIGALITVFGAAIHPSVTQLNSAEMSAIQGLGPLHPASVEKDPTSEWLMECGGSTTCTSANGGSSICKIVIVPPCTQQGNCTPPGMCGNTVVTATRCSSAVFSTCTHISAGGQSCGSKVLGTCIAGWFICNCRNSSIPAGSCGDIVDEC